MNQNYQAEKLLKRLQNNPIKNHVKFKKFSKSTRVAFSFRLLHSLVIVLVDALAQTYILGSADQYQNVVVLFAVKFGGLSQDQRWPLRFDNMELNSEKLTYTEYGVRYGIRRSLNGLCSITEVKQRRARFILDR